jgi:hypothetical protein
MVMLMLLIAGVAAIAQQKPPVASDPALNSYEALSVSGVVLDPSNASIAGAKVTLYGRRLDSPLSKLTDSVGKFQFDRVVPDTYEIDVQQDGFRPARIRVKVESRAPVPLRVVLQLAELRQQIEVADLAAQGKVSGEIADNADAVTLSRQELNSLPILGGDVVGAIIRILGPTGSSGVTLIVDGVPTSDIGVPPSDIESVKINQDPYSAEFSSPGQNRIEITTKAGSRHFHGLLDTQYRNYNFDARNPFALHRPEDRHINVNWSLSGPLSKSGKTTFSFSGERVDDDAQSVVNALTPAGAIRENFPVPERSIFLSGRINRQSGQNNTLSLRYSFFDWSNDGQGVGGFALPDSASNSTSRRHYIMFSDRAVVTPNLVNELSARVVTSQSLTQSTLPGTPAIVVLGAFTGGGGQQDNQERRDYLALTEMLSWSHGKHLTKAGVNVPALGRFSVNDRSNFDGTFQFASLEDYQRGRPFSFVRQQGNPRLVYWQKELGGFVQDEVRFRPDLSVAFGLRYEWQNYVSNHKNFAPRISVAYAPGKSRTTVMRAGVGIFYQTTGPSAIEDMLRFNSQTLRQIVLSNPGYPDPFSRAGIPQVLPSSEVQFAPALRLPYVLQFSYGVETQLLQKMTFTARYIGTRGYDLFLSRDINAPLPPYYLQRPNADIGTLRQVESAGQSESNALYFSISTKLRKFFSGRMQYTFGRSYDDTSGINWFPANQYNQSGEWARSDRDARHSAYLYGAFHAGGFFDLGMVLSGHSGLPYTMTTGTDVYGTTFANARPPGVPRNSLQGSSFISLDLRLDREFYLRRSRKQQGEGPTARIALDAFNVTNHVNFGKPVGDLSSPFFGRPISATSARRLQLSLGFAF